MFLSLAPTFLVQLVLWMPILLQNTVHLHEIRLKQIISTNRNGYLLVLAYLRPISRLQNHRIGKNDIQDRVFRRISVGEPVEILK
jgi:hypothetical protein